MKHPPKLRTPSELSDNQGTKSPVSIYMEDELSEWVDGVRGKLSRSALVNEALRFYRDSLEAKARKKPVKS